MSTKFLTIRIQSFLIAQVSSVENNVKKKRKTMNKKSSRKNQINFHW